MSLSVQAFDHGGNALPHADTHRGQTQGTFLLLQHVQQGGGDTRPGATQRVTQSDSAAVEVHALFHAVGQAQDGVEIDAVGVLVEGGPDGAGKAELVGVDRDMGAIRRSMLHHPVCV